MTDPRLLSELARVKVDAATRKLRQDLYIRVCRDSGFRLDYVRAAQLAAAAGGFHPMDVWIAMPNFNVMQEIAAGTHPAAAMGLPSPVRLPKDERA